MKKVIEFLGKLGNGAEKLGRTIEEAVSILRDKADPNGRISARRGVGTAICLWALYYANEYGLSWQVIVVLAIGAALIGLSSINYTRGLEAREQAEQQN